jgi:ABC-type dipeptide/oligopeptide/nickel transport system ATPase subunit
VTSGPPVLSADGLTVVFGAGAASFAAVDDVSVEVHAGEAIGIVGESGSGKSTLARVLAGIHRPDAGETILDGVAYSSGGRAWGPPRSDRWKVQMVFQSPYSSLNPRLRAWQTVAEACRVWRRETRSAARQDAYRLLASVGITREQAEQRPRALSGGQRQRVSIARALVPNPLVLLADEPTSAIDQSAQAQLLNLLHELQENRRLALVFISHDLGLVRYLTTRAYVMNSGRVVESGPTDQIFLAPREEYTRQLIEAMPGGSASESGDGGQTDVQSMNV